jgi:hypothetical protein
LPRGFIYLSGLASDDAKEDFVNRLQMTLFGWIKKHPSPKGMLYVIDEAQITEIYDVGKTASRDPATVPAGNSLQDAANSLLGLMIERFGEVVAHPILGGLSVRSNLDFGSDNRRARPLCAPCAY